MQFIDSFLNSVTMYRLVLYVLRILAGVGIVFSFLGWLPFNWIAMVITLLLTIGSCLLSNVLFARLFKVPVNYESYAITSVILFLILAPVTNGTDGIVTFAAGCIAIASKYLLAINKKHVVNPAAFAIFLLGLLQQGNGIWWIGSVVMLPFTLVLGLLVVRKVRRFQLLFAFLIPAVITLCLFNLRNGLTIPETVQQVITSWPIIFFGTIMLTEPLTMPPRTSLSTIYGGLIGVLFGVQFSVGPLNASPEFALVVGNIYSYIVSPKGRLTLFLKKRVKLASGIYEFIFTKNQSFAFQPGQYLEWTVPPVHIDRRGNRRYFTIASSPTESEIRLGVKVVAAKGSQFKKQLMALQEGQTITASHLAGDFIMPEDASQKLVWIAGGIGVTPFRSQIGYLLDNKQKRNICLFYIISSPEEIAYKDVFTRAEKELGIQVIYVISKPDAVPNDWKGEVGRLNESKLSTHLKQVKDYTYYLSGPNALVETYKTLLRSLGVSSKKIITDYFPGF